MTTSPAFRTAQPSKSTCVLWRCRIASRCVIRIAPHSHAAFKRGLLRYSLSLSLSLACEPTSRWVQSQCTVIAICGSVWDPEKCSVFQFWHSNFCTYVTLLHVHVGSLPPPFYSSTYRLPKMFHFYACQNKRRILHYTEREREVVRGTSYTRIWGEER